MKKAFTIFLFSLIILCGTVRADYPQIVHQSLARVIYTSSTTESIGSGVVINGKYVLSCFHLIKDKPGGKFSIIVGTSEMAVNIGADVIKVDSDKDLMLLKLSETIPWETTHLADEIKWGELMYYGGYSVLPLPKIRIGVITTRFDLGIYLHPIYFADSGGGVFNANQELIGIIYKTYVINGIPSLIGYAVPLDDIREFIGDELQK